MLVSRMFHTHDDAASAVAELKQNGFREAAIRVIDKAEDEISVTHMTQHGVSDEARAHQYADGINQGRTLVIVDAPPGSSATAKAILEQARPGDADTPVTAHEEAYVRPQQEATTISAAAPLSSKLNWPVLLHDPTPLSSRLNLKVLSDNPTPLSSWLNIPVLWGDKTTRS